MKRTNVIGLRAGFDEARPLANCLTFVRTRQIAIRLADARESELQHIRGCSECAARLRVFQRDLHTEPDEVVHDELRHASHEISGDHAAEGFAEVWRILAHSLYSSTKFTLTATFGGDVYVSRAHWNHTHDLHSLLRHAKREAGPYTLTVLNIYGIALGHAASTYALITPSVDGVLPLTEGLEEGFAAVQGSGPLSHGYGKLLAHVAVEGPPVVRHATIWTIWNLFGHGHEARHVASAALERIVRSRFASEVTPAAALIWQLHSHGKQQKRCSSPELPALFSKVGEMQEHLVQLLTGHAGSSLHERMEELLAETFDERSAQSQIVHLMIARTALRDALRIAAERGVHTAAVQEWISHLFVRARERARAVLVDAELAATACESFPSAYTHALIHAIRPDAKLPRPLDEHERHILLLSAIKLHNRRVLGGAPGARFRYDGGHWTFTSANQHGLDHLFHELAAIATVEPSYAFHLEWANAHFIAPRSKHHKASRGDRGRNAARVRHHHTVDIYG